MMKLALAGALLRLDDSLGVNQIVGQRDFDQHMFAGFHAGDCLRSMHLRGCRQDDRIDVVECQRVGEIIGPMADAVVDRDRFLGASRTVNDRDHLGTVDHLDGGKVFAAESSCSGEGQLHHLS
jgi:hypothetical protein